MCRAGCMKEGFSLFLPWQETITNSFSTVCRMVSSSSPIASLEGLAGSTSCRSGLITGGTGSLGCLVAHWLTQSDMPPSHLLAETGRFVMLLGRTGRASSVARLLMQAQRTPSLVSVRQCDASCHEDLAASMQPSSTVSFLLLSLPGRTNALSDNVCCIDAALVQPQHLKLVGRPCDHHPSVLLACN